MSVNAWLILVGLFFVGGLLVFSVVRFLTRERVPYWEAEGASTDAGTGTKGAQQAADADADVVDAEFEEVKDNKKSA